MKKQSEIINSKLSCEKCVSFFNRYRYFIHEESAEQLVLKKQGTSFTTSMARIPLELSFKFDDSSTKVFLKYDCFILFDTGDLRKELDRIIKIIEDNHKKLL